jgi:YYY domain-containing protein
MLRSDPPGFEITEFPYFSFLYADLHAHVMALPFAIAAIGACLALALGRARERRAWREWLVVALLGLLVGSLRWLNSWDYPPYLLLGLAAIVIGERRVEGGPAAAAARVALKGAVLVGASVLLFLPFLRSYHQPVGGLEPTPTTTHLDQYLAHFGLFLAATFAFLLFLLLRSLRRSPLPSLGVALRRGGPRGLLWAYNRLPSRDLAWTSLFATALGLLTVAAAYFALRGDTATAALVPALALVAYLAQRELRRQRPDSGPRLMALTLLGLALGLSLAVEFVRIEGDVARMNTVFKFYLHVWVLLALLSAYAVWQLLFIAWSPAPRTEEGVVRHIPRFAGGFALGALLIGALIYTVAATPVRLDNRFLDLPNTKDGAAYMRAATYYDAKGPIVLSYDYEGIQWLRANVQGSPAIVEGRTPLYRWGGRFSIYTGLPTVLGWDWHQVQQRGQFAFMIDQRAREVERFYNDPDPVQAVLFLKQYDVRYVVVGQLERLYYTREGLAKFAGGLGNVLEPAYENGALTIYRVRTDQLPGALPVLP